MQNLINNKIGKKFTDIIYTIWDSTRVRNWCRFFSSTTSKMNRQIYKSFKDKLKLDKSIILY